MSEELNKSDRFTKLKSYLKKLGVVGLLFFLIKGLVWIYIFYFVKSKL